MDDMFITATPHSNFKDWDMNPGMSESWSSQSLKFCLAADRMGERPRAGTVRKLFKIFLVGIGEGVVVFAVLLCL